MCEKDSARIYSHVQASCGERKPFDDSIQMTGIAADTRSIKDELASLESFLGSGLML